MSCGFRSRAHASGVSADNKRNARLRCCLLDGAHFGNLFFSVGENFPESKRNWSDERRQGCTSKGSLYTKPTRMKHQSGAWKQWIFFSIDRISENRAAKKLAMHADLMSASRMKPEAHYRVGIRRLRVRDMLCGRSSSFRRIIGPSKALPVFRDPGESAFLFRPRGTLGMPCKYRKIHLNCASSAELTLKPSFRFGSARGDDDARGILVETVNDAGSQVALASASSFPVPKKRMDERTRSSCRPRDE